MEKRNCTHVKVPEENTAGKLAGRVAETMLHQVEGSELIFTCPNPDRVPEEKKERWNQAGVALRAASYDDEEQMAAAFSGGERLFFISSILNGERRVRQHRSVIEACKKAGIGHITYTSFFGANREGYPTMWNC